MPFSLEIGRPTAFLKIGGQVVSGSRTIDGRNPALSLGMSFAELQRLSRRLGLRSALNLDGGGSPTMAAGLRRLVEQRHRRVSPPAA